MADIAELGFKVDDDGLLRAEQRLKALPPAADAAEKATDRFNKRADESTKSVTKLASGIGKLGGVIGTFVGAVAAAFSVSALINYTNVWTDLGSRVELATGAMGKGAETMQRLYKMARLTYSGFEQTAETFLGNATALRELGKTTSETLDYVEAVNNALVVSGAKGQRAESVMNALNKSMALGALKGDQLETVLASGGRVTQVLADYLGVTTLELRKLGAEGKITGDVIYRSLVGSLETLRTEAGNMPATIGDAFVLLNNALLQFIGGTDQAIGASAMLAEVIIYLADNIEHVLVIAGTFAAVMALQWVTGFTAAAIATGGLTGALVLLRAAMIRTGIGVLVIAAGELIYQFMELVERTGSFQNAMIELGRLAGETWQRIASGGAALSAAMTGVALEIAATFTQAWADILHGFINMVNQIPGIGSSGILGDQFSGLQGFVVSQYKQSDELRNAAGAAFGASSSMFNNMFKDFKTDSIGAGASWEQLTNEFAESGPTIKNTVTDMNALTGAANDNKAATEKLTDAQKEAKKAAEEFNEAGRSLVSSFLSDIKSELMNGASLWDAFAMAGANALDTIANKALDMAANGIWDMIFGAAGSLFGGGGMSAGASSAWGNIFGFASGGYTGNGSTSEVAGAVHKREFVMNAAATQRIGVDNLSAMNENRAVSMGSSGGGNSGGGDYNDNRQFHIDARGAQQGVGEEIRAALEKYDANLPDRLVEIDADPRKRVA